MEDINYKTDIEDEPQLVEKEPLDFWEKKQKELITSVVDYNLGTISDLITAQDIDLSPSYQRRFRWDEARQSLLIESFLMNVPVPPIFLNEDAYGQYSVIDGKQRLTAIHNFLRGRLTLQGLKIFSNLNGNNFDSLPSRIQTILRTRAVVRAIIILRQSDPDIKLEVFQRLNMGGVSLNAQELRNSVYIGPLNNLILELSEHPKFHKLLGIKQKENSKIYREMRDAELVLRFFTFRRNWNEFSGGMRYRMDEYMRENRKKFDNKTLEDMRKEFINTLNAVEFYFGENSFRRWIPEKKQWKKLVLASLYDAEMFACRDISLTAVESHRNEILEGLKNLFSNEEFRQSIDAATNSPSSFRTRVTMMKTMIDKIIQN